MPLRARTFRATTASFYTQKRRSTSTSFSCHSLSLGCALPPAVWEVHSPSELLGVFWVTMSPFRSNWLACSLSVTVCDSQTNKWIQKWESLFIMFSFAPHMGFQCSSFQNVILLRKTKNNKTNKTPRYNKSLHRKHNYF